MMSDVYQHCSAAFIDLVLPLGPAELVRTVPACPDWSVHDLLAHLAGSSTDVATGNTADAATPPWTHQQIAARRADTAAQLVEEWSANISAVAAQCDAPVPNPAWDVAVHLDDLREALRLGPSPSPDRDEVLEAALQFWHRRHGDAVAVSVADTRSDPGTTRWHVATTYGLWRALFSRLDQEALAREVLRGDADDLARRAYFAA